MSRIMRLGLRDFTGRVGFQKALALGVTKPDSKTLKLEVEGTNSGDTITVVLEPLTGLLKSARGSDIDRFTFDSLDQIYLVGSGGNVRSVR